MISVCMATYNGGKHIGKQIESILPQLSLDDEIIISDDGSTDETVTIINSFNDNRIKLFFNKKEKKLTSKHALVTRNFENALTNARGDIIFLSDQDDIWKDDKISIYMTFLKNHDLVLSNYDLIDNVGSITERMCLKFNPISKNFMKNILKMPFHGCCMAFRKDILVTALPFPNNLLLHDNWIGMIAFMNDKNKIKFINKSLIMYRQHGNNVSGISNNSLFFKLYYRVVFCCKLYIRILLKK